MILNAKKLFLTAFLCCFAGTVNTYAAGLDLTLFGYKLCDLSFDVNPFSRDDGRPKQTSCAVSTTSPSASPSSVTADTVNVSNNFTIINSAEGAKEYRYDGPPVYYASPYYSGSYRHWGWGGYYRRTR